jgi:hypothetical protein
MATRNFTSASAFGSMTISTTVIPISHATLDFSAAELAAAERATLTVRTAGVMYRYDGGDPTATVGHLLAQNGTATIEGNANVQALRFIREAAADAALSVTLEK